MTLKNIAFLGLMRQKGKKLFVVLAMALGCATVASLFTFIDTQKMAVERQLDEYGANIVVLPKSDDLGLTYGGINVSGAVANLEEISLSDVNRIWDIQNKDNIRAVSPKLLGAVEVKGKQDLLSQVLIVGVYFQEELKIKSWWELDGSTPVGPQEVIAGSDVAERLGVELGESILVGGKEFRVSGRLAPTGSQDDTIIFADFDTVSTLLGKPGMVSLAEVSALCTDCPIETIVSQMEGTLPGADIKPVRQMMQQKMQTISQFEKFALTVTMVIVVIGGLLVFLSMMGAVAERKQEIGIFRAVGFTRIHIATVVLSEALILSTVAGLLGSAAGLLVANLALPGLLDVGRELIVIDPVMLTACVTGVVLIGIIATIHPALRASNIDPVIAINSL